MIAGCDDSEFFFRVFVSFHLHLSNVLVYYMHSTSPVSYEHPRRSRPFNSPAEKGSPYRPDQYHFLDSRLTRLEEALARMESSMSKKFDSLNSRVDKCSELSVASSRAVAAVSAQLENLKNDQQKGVSSLNTAMKDIRTSATKLCTDSQSATMRALEDFTAEMLRRMEVNAESIDQIRHDQENLLYEQSKLLEVVEKELENVNLDISMMGQKLEETRNLSTTVPDHAIKEEIGTISEFICKSMLGDLEERMTSRCDGLSSQVKDSRFRTSEKLDQLGRFMSDTEMKFSKRLDEHVATTHRLVEESEARLSHRFQSSIPNIDLLRKELGNEISQLRQQMESFASSIQSSPAAAEIDATSFEPILARVEDLSRGMSEMTNLTLPQFIKEIDASIVSADYKTEQKTVQLLQDLCVEFDSDINRLVEMVHSVYVQANLTMPPGTLTSWKKFKEIMFDITPEGGRRPILGEAVLNHLASSVSGPKKHTPPGRLFSRS